MKTTQHTPGKHTELPWSYALDKDGPFEIYAPNNDDVVAIVRPEFADDEAEANAKFIVTACNAHYELLEACKALLEHHGSIDAPRAYRARAQAKAAIAKAQGKE